MLTWGEYVQMDAREIRAWVNLAEVTANSRALAKAGSDSVARWTAKHYLEEAKKKQDGL